MTVVWFGFGLFGGETYHRILRAADFVGFENHTVFVSLFLTLDIPPNLTCGIPKTADYSEGLGARRMVHDVLESDVQFAQGLMTANQSDKEIVSALSLRGVEPDKATRLVNDLRNRLSAKATIASLPRPREIPKPSPALPAEMQLVNEHKGERRPRHRRKSVPWWFLIIAAIFIWALVYCFLHEENSASDYDKHDLPAKPSSKDFDEKR